MVVDAAVIAGCHWRPAGTDFHTFAHLSARNKAWRSPIPIWLAVLPVSGCYRLWDKTGYVWHCLVAHLRRHITERFHIFALPNSHFCPAQLPLVRWAALEFPQVPLPSARLGWGHRFQ